MVLMVFNHINVLNDSIDVIKWWELMLINDSVRVIK